MPSRLEAAALDQLFRKARTYNSWTEEGVTEDQLRELYDLMHWGPTSANSCPARFVWVRSREGKERLSALAHDNNRAKILAAPVTVIIGYDLDFPGTLPRLFPARGENLQRFFTHHPGILEPTAFRNGSLQGAYLLLAARALGFNCGPMSGFDNEAVDREFFAGTRIKSNFLCSIGHGAEAGLFPRLPRLTFEEAGNFA
jgi:3-hydroxypropanoate dehydrogenase